MDPKNKRPRRGTPTGAKFQAARGRAPSGPTYSISRSTNAAPEASTSPEVALIAPWRRKVEKVPSQSRSPLASATKVEVLPVPAEAYLGRKWWGSGMLKFRATQLGSLKLVGLPGHLSPAPPQQVASWATTGVTGNILGISTPAVSA